MSIPQDFRPPPTGADAPIVPWRLDPRLVLVVGLASWLAAYGLSQTTVSDAGIPALFLPAGIAVGLLLRLPGRLWWWVLLAMLVIDVAGGTLTGAAPFAEAAIWGISNTTQALVLAWLLRGAKVDMSRTRDPLLLATIAGVVIAIIAVIGSLGLARISDVDATQFWADWWGTDMVSVVLVVPLLLLLGRASPPRGRRAAEALAWFVVAAAAIGVQFAGWVFPQIPVWVWLVTGTPLVVLYSVRFGLLAMSAFLLGLDWIAVSVTAAGIGPFITLAFREGTPLRTLQLVLIVVAVSVQSVSLIVYKSLRHSSTLAGQQALLDAVLEESPAATALLTPDSLHVVRTNRAFRALLPDHGDLEADLPSRFPERERPAVREFLSATADGPAATAEFAAIDLHGEPLLIRLRVVAVAADAFDRFGSLRTGVNLAWLVHAEDMTDVRRREERLRHDAITDPLTGLANRRQLLHALAVAVQAASPGALVSVAYIDLDGFKEVNDRLGHAIGDEVLQAVALCLTEAVSPSDLVARSGGDEFVVVTSGLPDLQTARLKADAVLKALLDCPSVPLSVAASIGVAVTGDPAESADDLLARGDRLMYAAKNSGGSSVVVDS